MRPNEPHPETSFQIRPATLDDVKGIVALVNSAFRGETGARAWTGEAHLLEGQRIDEELVNELIESPRAAVLVAHRNPSSPRPVGCVSMKKVGEVGCLGMLAVDVDEQRSGLGSLLVEEAEDYAQEVYEVTSIEMTVISVRTELIDWYRRRGYELTGVKRPFPYGDERFGIPLRDDLEFAVLKKLL